MSTLSELVKESLLTVKRINMCRVQLISLADKCHDRARNLESEGEEQAAKTWYEYLETIQKIQDQLSETEAALKDLLNTFRFYL